MERDDACVEHGSNFVFVVVFDGFSSLIVRTSCVSVEMTKYVSGSCLGGRGRFSLGDDTPMGKYPMSMSSVLH